MQPGSFGFTTRINVLGPSSDQRSCTIATVSVVLVGPTPFDRADLLCVWPTQWQFFRGGNGPRARLEKARYPVLADVTPEACLTTALNDSTIHRLWSCTLIRVSINAANRAEPNALDSRRSSICNWKPGWIPFYRADFPNGLRIDFNGRRKTVVN